MTITINKKHRTSNEDRRKVIIAYENGCSPANIAIVLGLKQTTVVGIIKVYSTEGRIGKKPRGGTREGHLTNSNRDSIRAWLDDDCSLSLHAISKRAGMIFPLLCLSALLHVQLTHFATQSKECPWCLRGAMISKQPMFGHCMLTNS
jgi:hypothetical protein